MANTMVTARSPCATLATTLISFMMYSEALGGSDEEHIAPRAGQQQTQCLTVR